MKDCDLLVIGAGPGGYTAAIRASQLGLKTVIVEKGEIGGTCLNRGCVPTKVLIEQAEIFRTISKSGEYGIGADFSKFDYSVVSVKAVEAVRKLTKGVEFLLKKNGVEIIAGEVKKIDAHTVYYENQKIQCKNILIATGSEPASLDEIEISEGCIINSDSALFLRSLPASIAIVGAGAIGVEFAYIFSSFGCDVHLVEAAKDILPGIDADISKEMAKSFKKEKKVKVYTESRAQIIQKDRNGAKLKISTTGREQTIEIEKVLVAVGRKPVVNFEIPKEIKTDAKGFIEVCSGYKTAVDSIYAIGDVVKTPLLAHVAAREGEVAVENMVGLSHPDGMAIDFSSVPYAVYSQPQAAGFGYSSLAEPDDDIASQSMFFKAIGKAVAVEKVSGLLKLYYNKKSRIIEGAHMCGYNASEIIHELIVAKEAKMGIEKIAQIVHVHPSFSEINVEIAKEICYGKQAN